MKAISQMKTMNKTVQKAAQQFKKPYEKARAAKKGAKAKAKTKGKLGQILGFSVISVIRAMGKAGWKFDEAQNALAQLKIAAKPHTVRMGLLRGRKNDKTRKIAPLSAKQLNTLRAKRTQTP